MVSELFKKVEDAVGNSLLVQQELVEAIAHKTGKHPQQIERALYVACVATSVRVSEAAFLVNEFLAALHETELPDEAHMLHKDSPEHGQVMRVPLEDNPGE